MQLQVKLTTNPLPRKYAASILPVGRVFDRELNCYGATVACGGAPPRRSSCGKASNSKMKLCYIVCYFCSCLPLAACSSSLVPGISQFSPHKRIHTFDPRLSTESIVSNCLLDVLEINILTYPQCSHECLPITHRYSLDFLLERP